MDSLCAPPANQEQGEDYRAMYLKVRDELAELQQRQWVGLTDDEVKLYWDWEDFQCGCGPSTLFAMVRDIEARLKDRNI